MDTAEELPTVIAFCAGYGGIERGLELAGVKHRVIAYVEIEAYCVANLIAKMEAGLLVPAPVYTDIKTFPSELFRGKVSLLTGGYPCQPFSAAGSRKGEDDPRHLWPFIRRHIAAIRPDRVFFENVEGHISLGLSSVIADLGEDDYRATWGIFSAREVGAPHQRKRVYILADSNGSGQQAQRNEFRPERQTPATCESSQLADSKSVGIQRLWSGGIEESDSHGQAELSLCQSQRPKYAAWDAEPRVGRVVDGCTNRVDRIRLLGNAVVPQTAAKAYSVLSERML